MSDAEHWAQVRYGEGPPSPYIEAASVASPASTTTRSYGEGPPSPYIEALASTVGW